MWEAVLLWSSLLASLLLLWFKTDAFAEYCSLLRFNIGKYEKEKGVNPNLTFPDFLILFHDSFLSRLISCPKCVSVWLSILFYFYHGEFMLVPVIYLFGLIIFYLTSFLEKKAYE